MFIKVGNEAHRGSGQGGEEITGGLIGLQDYSDLYPSHTVYVKSYRG